MDNAGEAVLGRQLKRDQVMPMKLRLAWLADAEDADSYSARETRVLLRAMARSGLVIPLWFALRSLRPPHLWNDIRVFPVPAECMETAGFLRTLLNQQRPHVILSNLPRAAFPAAFEYLEGSAVAWLQRANPADSQEEAGGNAMGTPAPCRHLFLSGRNGTGPAAPNTRFLPHLRGLDKAVSDGDEPTAVLRRLEEIINEAAAMENVHGLYAQSPAANLTEQRNGASLLRTTEQQAPVHVVMRQQLFCNASLAYVMFELTNALIELGVPTIPQDEHACLSKGFIHREEDLFRAGAPEKYERIAGRFRHGYDPEHSVTVHFSMLKHASAFTRFGVFHSLGPREVLYTTGNHIVTAGGVRNLASTFEKVLAPSWHVLQSYLDAGLDSTRGVVVPHGIDPLIYSPTASALPYPTGKRFKFLQTSFPWVYEKGFDLSINAFCRAFSSRDDVALILRVPRILDPRERSATFGRLEGLVKEALTQPYAPEILLLESDVPLNRRGGVYTAAECYLFPLRAEGFGMTILEAMACGLPVIATAWSGPADFLSLVLANPSAFGPDSQEGAGRDDTPLPRRASYGPHGPPHAARLRAPRRGSPVRAGRCSSGSTAMDLAPRSGETGCGTGAAGGEGRTTGPLTAKRQDQKPKESKYKTARAGP